jgi:hypothetical protein
MPAWSSHTFAFTRARCVVDFGNVLEAAYILNKHYNKGGQTFLLEGQILKIFFISGRKFLTFELCFHILSFLMPFGF